MSKAAPHNTDFVRLRYEGYGSAQIGTFTKPLPFLTCYSGEADRSKNTTLVRDPTPKSELSQNLIPFSKRVVRVGAECGENATLARVFYSAKTGNCAQPRSFSRHASWVRQTATIIQACNPGEGHYYIKVRFAPGLIPF